MTDDGDPATVLALAPVVGDESFDACVQVLETAGDLDRIVGVTVAESAAEWVDAWTRFDPSTPVTCVDLDAPTRSVAHDAGVSGDADTPVVPDGARPDVTIERVRDPTNLERVGRTVSDALQQAEERNERVGLAVHSLSGLLQHVDEAVAFKFVYTLGEVVRRVDGVACFHLDPTAHDDETVDTFSVACDAEADVDWDRNRPSSDGD